MTCGLCATFKAGFDDEEGTQPTADTPKSLAQATRSAKKMMELEIVGSMSPMLESIQEGSDEKEDFGESPTSKKTARDEEQRDEPEEEKNGRAYENLMAEIASENEAISKKVVVFKPVEEIIFKEDADKERDYDKDPSPLYVALQKKDWDGTLQSIEKCPEDVWTWIVRKEENGSLRWKVLPIHGAMIFNAPDYIVKALLTAYPEGAKAQDDQGKVPLHYCVRVNSSESVVRMLLSHCPEAAQLKDHKGRTPADLADICKTPYKDIFFRILASETSTSREVLSKGKSDPTEAPREIVAILEAKIKTLQENHVFEIANLEKKFTPIQEGYEKEIGLLQAKVQGLLQKHQADITGLKQTSSAKVAVIEKSIEDLQADLSKSNETSQVLVEHITSLETQLNNEQSKYEEAVKAWKKEKEEATKNLRLALDAALKEKNDLADNLEKQTQTVQHMEEDCRRLRADVNLLQENLKKSSTNERSLAAQVALLGNQLGATVEDNKNATEAFTARVRTLDQERDDLRLTVNKLSKKLYRVASFLDEMAKEQESIIEKACEHEAEMAAAAAQHAKLVEQVEKQQVLLNKAKDERDYINSLVNSQNNQLDKNYETNQALLSAVTDQAKKFEQNLERRRELIKEVSELKSQMVDAMDSVINGLPQQVDDDELLVDQVLSTILSHNEEDGMLETENAERAEHVAAAVDAAFEKPVDVYVNEPKDAEEEKEDHDHQEARVFDDNMESEAVAFPNGAVQNEISTQAPADELPEDGLKPLEGEQREVSASAHGDHDV